jgi:hypothetical protein
MTTKQLHQAIEAWLSKAFAELSCIRCFVGRVSLLQGTVCCGERNCRIDRDDLVVLGFLLDMRSR